MQTLIRILAIIALCSPAIAQNSEPCDHQETYEAAYNKAFKTEKPLLVLLTAKWCGPCQSYKSDVLEPMDKANEFDGFVFVKLDYDENVEVSQRIMSQTENRRIPQLVSYVFKNNKWQRNQLLGKQPIEEVRKLIKKTKDAKNG